MEQKCKCPYNTSCTPIVRATQLGSLEIPLSRVDQDFSCRLSYNREEAEFSASKDPKEREGLISGSFDFAITW